MNSLIIKARRKARRGVKSFGESVAKQLTIPDQALSIQEILKRYTRGVPVDVKMYDPVYLDQEDYDMESLSRLEFSEKMSVAEKLRAQYDAVQKAAEEREQAKQREKDEAREKRIQQLEAEVSEHNKRQKEPEGSEA